MFESPGPPMRSANHPREADRIAFLKRIGILDSAVERMYDDIVSLAATICSVPIAVISFIDEERQWFKSQIGLEGSETSREQSFCSHAILDCGPTIVEDATVDDRFKDHELVLGEFHLRFYLGVPIHVEGLPMGTLCVVDLKPRTLSSAQIAALETLGRQLSAYLQSRLSEQRLSEATERLQRTEALLDLSRKRLEGLFEAMATATYTTDLNGTIYEFNLQAESLFGLTAGQAIGMTDFKLLVSRDEAEHAAACLAVLATGEPIHNVERKIVRADGALVCTIMSAQPLTGLSGEISGAIYSYVDIEDRKRMESELVQANAQLEVLSTTDGLTKIYNRRAISSVLESELKSVPRIEVSILLLDVDHFKQFNDEFGHLAGDEVLKSVGSLLKEGLRPADSVGRFGGEEFLVVLPRTSSVEAMFVAERLSQRIEVQTWPHRKVTVSIGVATSTAERCEPSALISLADVRLYAAKTAGRNRVVGATDEESSERLEALGKGEISQEAA